ncbi:hypothetical protein SAMN05421824_1807 [Hyunsoonleella jejuensis]|uniref:Uncharacterized protein n=1 Tax=Hyunsoonleella jejuensis TaxID=419940 RepID=A0A1H9GIK8_9FLAO|nr:hypothetical protein [Hyunsoonleella jejuensis]SEQ49922.1 hypothetical protein SAMN05421824_1807 [Hyunsoonleella jejuensis]
MAENKKSTLSFLKESIPITYIILVCFGYFNKSLYFDKFGVDILYYLTVQELAFSFIPVGSAIVVALLFMIIILAPMVVFGSDEYIDSEMEKDRFNPYQGINKIKHATFKKISKHTYWIISIATSLYLNLIPILLVAYFAIFRKIGESLPNSELIVLLMIFWGIIFFLKFKFHQNSKNKKNPRIILFVYFILMIVVFIVYSEINIKRAERIRNGDADYSIHLINDKKEIKTTKELIFFGQTNDFIFLRNTNTNENRILKKSDFKELIIKKLKK